MNYTSTKKINIFRFKITPDGYELQTPNRHDNKKIRELNFDQFRRAIFPEFGKEYITH